MSKSKNKNISRIYEIHQDALQDKKKYDAKSLKGFNFTFPEQIKKIAREKNLRVLLVYSADWCPSCVYLKEYVFPTDIFQKTTKDVVKVYVDDLTMSNLWEKLNPRKALPSVILLDSELNEIDRMQINLLHNSAFIDWFDKNKNYNMTIAELKQKVNTYDSVNTLNDEQLSNVIRLAEWLLNSGDIKEAAISSCIDNCKNAMQHSVFRTSRYSNQLLINCYKKLKQEANVDSVYTKLVKAYPHEFYLNNSYANYLVKKENLNEAYVYATLSLKYSYGNPWYHAVFLKADIEVKMSKKEAAIETLSEALKETKKDNKKTIWQDKLHLKLKDLTT